MSYQTEQFPVQRLVGEPVGCQVGFTEKMPLGNSKKVFIIHSGLLPPIIFDENILVLEYIYIYIYKYAYILSLSLKHYHLWGWMVGGIFTINCEPHCTGFIVLMR